MPMVSQPIDETDATVPVGGHHAVTLDAGRNENKFEQHAAADHQGEHARERAPGSAANQGYAPPGSNFKGRTFRSIPVHSSAVHHTAPRFDLPTPKAMHSGQIHQR